MADPTKADDRLDPAQERRQRRVLRLHGIYKRALSPLLHVFVTSQCKYLPTCSDFAYAAVVRHGWVKGGWLALRRVGRCHPFAKGGFDPVP